MTKLVTTRNLADPDGVYTRLIRAHDAKTKAQSDAFNARLILLLINHIGDEEVIEGALAAAEDSAAAEQSDG